MNLLLLVQLFLAHILTDFVLQPTHWVNKKKDKIIATPYFWIHIILAALLSYILIADWSNWQIPLIIFLTHGLIDFTKSILERRNQYNDITIFTIDQVAHLIVIVFIWLAYSFTWSEFLNFIHPTNNLQFWVIITTTITLSTPAGIIIGKIVEPFRKNLGKSDSLKNAGKYIGIIERLLIFIFILLNQYSAIGFLLASKSILRISRDTDKNARKKTEYVLVGTLLSFLFAIVVALLAKTALSY